MPRVLAFACSVVAAGQATAANLPSTGTTVQVQRRCFVDSVRVSGFFAQRGEFFVLGGPDGYRIAAVLVQEGDRVTAGQDLIRLEPASTAPAPPGPGTPAGAMPPIVLKSPAAGTVSVRNARVGGLGNARGEPLLRITTNADLDLVVDVPSAYVTRVKEGGGARLLLEDGQEIRSQVRVPPAEIDARTQFARAHLAVPSGGGMRPGMFGRAMVDTDQGCGPSVPKSAILRQNNTTSVLLIRDGRPVAQRVEIGLSSREHVEIVSGLQEGQSVVANAAGAL